MKIPLEVYNDMQDRRIFLMLGFPLTGTITVKDANDVPHTIEMDELFATAATSLIQDGLYMLERSRAVRAANAKTRAKEEPSNTKTL